MTRNLVFLYGRGIEFVANEHEGHLRPYTSVGTMIDSRIMRNEGDKKEGQDRENDGHSIYFHLSPFGLFSHHPSHSDAYFVTVFAQLQE